MFTRSAGFIDLWINSAGSATGLYIRCIDCTSWLRSECRGPELKSSTWQPHVVGPGPRTIACGACHQSEDRKLDRHCGLEESLVTRTRLPWQFSWFRDSQSEVIGRWRLASLSDVSGRGREWEEVRVWCALDFQFATRRVLNLLWSLWIIK